MRHMLQAAFFLFVAILFLPRAGTAQWDYLDVPPGFETLNLAIEGDTTASGDPVSLNRVYRLQRGGMYLINGRMSNIKGAPLRIWAADGTGAKPLLIFAVNESGANDDMARLYGDGHFKNLYISGIDNIGNQDRYTMAVYDTGGRVVWEGVHVDHARQSHFRTYGTNTRLFFIDCEFRNGIDLANTGNGRFFDSRGLTGDTLMFQNCTMYLNAQRMVRTDGAIFNTIILDHNTFYQNAYGAYTTSVGSILSGPVETTRGVNVRVTNNIFQDLCTEGQRYRKELDPVDRLKILPVDSLKSPTIQESERHWLVRNNAYGWSPIFKTFWQNWVTDTVLVKAPAFIGPYGDSVFFRNNPNFVQTGNFEELIQFADAPSPDSLMKWVSYRFTSNFNNIGNPDPRADRNGIGDLTNHQETFGLESDPFNFDYPTSQLAYTAGDGGFPLGDLNWFPTKKAEWLLTDVKPEEGIATEYRLAQNFPNPFNPATVIEYSLPKASRVSVAIYNAIGQEIARLVGNEMQSPGAHEVTWNGKDASGKAVSSGVYFYRLETPDARITKKMMLLK